MNLQKATYDVVGQGPTEFEYDADAPCRLCGEPVIEASMGGTDVCPWCDCGKPRPAEIERQEGQER